jgi:hypothetical protein
MEVIMLKLFLEIINYFIIPLLIGVFSLAKGLELLLTAKQYYFAGACLFFGIICSVSFGVWLGLICFNKFN